MAENQPKRRGRPAKQQETAPATDVPTDVADDRTAIPAKSEDVSDEKVQSAHKKMQFQSLDAYLQYLAKEKRNGR
ncbi:hypothetical protein ADT27_10265 [Xanthomonas oryzae]|nr:hypothetical protein ADT27_10265 [Xanthomonas oryzae]